MIPAAWMGGCPEGCCDREKPEVVDCLVGDGTKQWALPVDFPDWAAVHWFFQCRCEPVDGRAPGW
jgi:hypothetical protein